METQFTAQQKPTLVNAIAWMTLASGMVNLFWGLGLVLFLWWTVICIPFLILPTVLGIFEIIYAAKLMSNPPQTVQPSTTLAILEIISVVAGNLFSLVVGILCLVFYNDVTVREYFARLNGTLVPVAPPAPLMPVIPVPEPEPMPEPAPAAPQDAAPVEEPPATEPAPEEPLQKPKRPRKVAK